MAMTFQIGVEKLQCAISEIGAELISVKYCGKERLWQNDNGSWSGHAPILFPYGGNCAVVVDGVTYPLQKHGFLASQVFRLQEKTENSITLACSSNEKTKSLYPYDFTVVVTYLIEGNCLKVTYKAINDGNRVMYAGFGCHESYALDGEVSGYEVVFEKDEELLSLVASADDGRMTGEVIDLGKGKALALPEPILNDTVILKTNSHCVTLKKIGEEKPLARVTYPNFPYLLIWQAKGGKMVCIEPWHNLPDDQGTPSKELSQKQGLTALQPNESLVAYHEIEYFE